MKRRYLIIPMLIIVLLLITSILINNQENNQTIIENHNNYSRITINYLNNEKYNTIEESITFQNNAYTYVKKILYQSEQITISKEGILTNENNNYLLDDFKLTMINQKLCSNKTCHNPFYKSNIEIYHNYITEFNSESSLKSLKKITPSQFQESITIIAILNDNDDSKKLKDNLLTILNDYDTTIYYLNIDKLSSKNQKKLQEEYNITDFPTTLVFKNEELLLSLEGLLNAYDLHNLLTTQGFKSR